MGIVDKTVIKCFSPAQEDAMIRFAIIGAGWIGGIHADRLQRCPGARLAAVFDVDREVRDRLAGLIASRSRTAGTFPAAFGGVRDAVVAP